MARSGSVDFGLTRDGIIRGAVRIVKGLGGKVPEGAQSGQVEFSNAAEALNMMLKQLQSDGVGLWLNKEIIIFPAYRDGKYSLGPTGDHATLTLVETEISTAASSSDAALVVDSTAGMTAADNIGIQLDDGTLQWTDISAGGVVDSTNLNLDASLTDDAAVDNNVYTYTTIIDRPLVITEARLYYDAGNEITLNPLNRDEWMELSNKETNGTPTSWYYDPQLDNGIFYLYPRPNEVSYYIKATARMPIQDFDAAGNDPDFPQECYRPIKFMLAEEISHEYSGIEHNSYLRLKRKADELYTVMKSWDAVYGSIFLEHGE